MNVRVDSGLAWNVEIFEYLILCSIPLTVGSSVGRVDSENVGITVEGEVVARPSSSSIMVMVASLVVKIT